MMPRGLKVGKYSTLRDNDEGMDYRSIAEIMTRRGHKMNFSSARNVFLTGMERVADAILKNVGASTSPEFVAEVAKNPNFQSYIMDALENSWVSEGLGQEHN